VRRLYAAALFALLGFVSLLLGGLLITWACEHFGGVCSRTGSACPIDNCTPHGLHNLALGAFYFGPAIAFALAAFIFGRRPRAAPAWLLLGVCLVVLHAFWMFAVTYSGLT
jgi:hypothetical protein